MFDAQHYYAMAQDFLVYRSFSDGTGNYHFYRLPGYPLFLVFCHWLGGGISLVIFFQTILALTIPVVVFCIARQLACSRKPSLIAAAIIVVHPGFLIFPGLIMSEIVFTIIFLFFILLLLHGRRSSNSLFMILSGLLLGCATLTRPVVGFPLFVFAHLVIFLMSNSCFKRKIIAMLFHFVGWTSIVGLWVLRNFFITGYFFLHTLSGNHCINHGAVPVVMKARGCSYIFAKNLVQKEVCSVYRTHHQWNCEVVEKSQLAEACAYKIMLSHPFELIRHCIVNIVKTLGGLYSAELLVIDSGGELPGYSNERGFKEMLMRFLFPSVHNWMIIPIIYFEIFLHFFVLLGALLFVFMSFYRVLWRDIIFFVIPLVTIFVVFSCLCGFARLRLPIECFLIMVAVEFWYDMASRKRA